MKKYTVMLNAYIDITNTTQMINWANQGWTPNGNDPYHSLMICVSKAIEVETDSIELYVEAIHELNRDIQVEWYEEVKA